MIIQERTNEFTAPQTDYYDAFIDASVAARESQNQPERVCYWTISNDWPSASGAMRPTG